MQKRLYIEVRPTGKKIWRFKYTFNGKEGTISFGEYPIVSLAEARKKKDESRALLKDDIKPCKYGQFSLQRIRSVIHKSLGIYFIKFRWISRLIQSIQMGLMTQNNTVRSLQIGKRMQWFHPEKMRSLGKITKSIRENEMNYFEQLNVSVGHYGKNGQAIIAEVWSKPRCIASNYWAINSVLGTFKAKSMRYMPV